MYNVQRRKIYSSLKRFDTDVSLEQAATDDHRSGRSRKPLESQQEKFEEIVHDPPEEVGIDSPAHVPSVELSGQRHWTCPIGATTEDVDCFFSRFTEYVTAAPAKQFILALCKEFEGDLIVVLDGAPYFQASAVTDPAARDELTFVTYPAYLPEFNPVEEC